MQLDLIDIAISESMGNYTRQGSHYSGTELIHSPRLVLLRRRYEKQRPPADKSNSWASFKGNGIHNEMKRGLFNYKRKLQVTNPEEAEKMLVEYRVMDKIHGRRISGQPDLVYGSTLYDYKTKKAWSRPYFSNQMDGWEMQLNVYAYLLREYDVIINKAYIVALYLDWSQYMADKNPGKYPQTEQEYISINVWDYEQQKDFIEIAVAELLAAEMVDDDDLPKCTSEDTWQRDIYKVFKVRGVRASKVFTSEVEAREYLNLKGSDYYIVEEEGNPLFCSDYCWCREYCSQWKEWCAAHGKA